MAGTGAKNRLAEISEALSENPNEPQRFTVREILHWFGYQRRARLNLRDIRNTLRGAGLTTDPDLNSVHIDSQVSFHAKDQASGDSKSVTSPATLSTSQAKEPASVSSPTEGEEQADDSAVMANLVSRLASANRDVTSVSPTDTIEEAVTTMLVNDYSQMPVMTTEREVKGMISWHTIGYSLTQGVQPRRVQDCMAEQYRAVRPDSRLLDVVVDIVESGAVLVQAKDRQVLGIITTADLSEEFKKLAEPFLQIGEIEQHLRNLFGNISIEKLRSTAGPHNTKEINDISDLTLGGLEALLSDHDAWTKSELKLDRKVLGKAVAKVREIRNDVMHFNPDGLDDRQLGQLQEMSKMFHDLWEQRRRREQKGSQD